MIQNSDGDNAGNILMIYHMLTSHVITQKAIDFDKTNTFLQCVKIRYDMTAINVEQNKLECFYIICTMFIMSL